MIVLKNQLNHQLNIVVLKRFAATKYLGKYSFLLFKFVSRHFFKKKKILWLSQLLPKISKICCIDFFCQYKRIFVSFAKLLNISLDKYSLFLSDVKPVLFFFKWWQGVNKNDYYSAFFRRIINKLFRAIKNIPLRKFKFEAGIKRVYHFFYLL